MVTVKAACFFQCTSNNTHTHKNMTLVLLFCSRCENEVGVESTDMREGDEQVCMCVCVTCVCSGPEEKLSEEYSPEPIEY